MRMKSGLSASIVRVPRYRRLLQAICRMDDSHLESFSFLVNKVLKRPLSLLSFSRQSPQHPHLWLSSPVMTYEHKIDVIISSHFSVSTVAHGSPARAPLFQG